MGMRTILQTVPTSLIILIEQLRAKLHEADFKARHRVRPEDFTRDRQWTFPVLMLFVLQKTVKSIQRHLHEFLDELAEGQWFAPVTAGAVTHARAKLQHTAFIELNQQVVLPVVNQQSDRLRRWHGHRLFGHDSSLLRLPDGKLEVLVTTLLDERKYPTEEFLEVYHGRWGHETFYSLLKGRLDLENFSGETVEAVRQDFHATVLLCNLESLLTEPAQAVVKEKSAEHQQPKQINRADAYHALKDRLLELLYSDTPPELVIRQLQCLFLARPISVPPDRKVPRRKQSFHRSYHFQRHVKKIVF